ncbi:MAG TPA: MAPEG family protein [Rudaea sp.]|nr:MAPEG family protein [Rudaea sp.]HSC10824.1 MAPEG family protein [Rhodanobacteraceae bacterium]
MAWVHLVALLALLECFFFAYAVGKARETYQLRAPATTGNENFERYFRVQQNTIEQMILFLPSLFIAAVYWPAQWVAALGAVYLVGRIVYYHAYVRDPRSRGLGFLLSSAPIILLVVAGAIGVVRVLLSG